MKKLITIFALIFSATSFSQNVGIGTTSPTNTLHIVPIGVANPLRINGMNLYTTEQDLLIINPITGVVKYMPINDVLGNVDSTYLDSTILTTILNNIDTIFSLMRDSLLLDSTFMATLRDSVDTDIDSMVFINDTLYLYEDNQILSTYINASTDTNLVDSLILLNSDTLYSIISDSLLKDSLWITQLDSLLNIYGDTIYFNDTTYSLISDSLLNDSLWIDSLGKLLSDNDWNINANGTGLEAAPAGNNFASGAYAIAAGQSDTATGLNSTISGGGQNKALGSYSSVTGGYQNLAQGSYSTVGGYRDTALGSYGGVLSGRENTIKSGSYSVIPGGYRNKITTSSYSSISGYRNFLDNSSHYAFINGSYDSIVNTATYSTVFGLRNKIDDGNAHSIVGGENNKIITRGAQNFISGGSNNRIIADGNSYTSRSVISGGSGNIIIGDTLVNSPGLYFTSHSGIYSGANDTLDGTRTAIIIGADGCKITGGIGNGIHSGRWSQIYSSNYSSIIGGLYNNINGGQRSSILGGSSNSIPFSTYNSVIIGGDSNVISSRNSVILGGRENVTTDYGQVALGYYSTSSLSAGANANSIDPDNILFKIGNGTSDVLRNNAMVVKANGNVGIGLDLPISKLDIENNNETSFSINSENNWEVTANGPVSALYSSAGGTGTFANLKVNTGIAATGTFYGHSIRVQRRTLGVDNGSMATTIGLSIYTGHENWGSGNPTSNIIKAIDISPRFSNGTINSYYSLYIGSSAYNTATVNNYYGIYQTHNTALNYLAGNLGLGSGNNSPTNQLHINATNPIRLEGLQTGGSTDSVLVTDGTGVVKKTSLNSITRTCGNYVFTNLNGETVISHGLFCTFVTPTYMLPAANTVTGRKYVVKLETLPATSATVSAISGNIDGAASFDMITAGVSSVILQSDGTNYWIIGSH